MRSAFKWFQASNEQDRSPRSPTATNTKTSFSAHSDCDHSSFAADSPGSLISASLTESPSPHPGTPTDLFPADFGTTATATSISKTITPRTPPRDDPYAPNSTISDIEFGDCTNLDLDMTTGPVFDSSGMGRSRQDSFVSAGPKPIAVKDANRDSVNRHRRESLAGSMKNGAGAAGASWAGLSLGSFVRDDIMMQGTSFGAAQSPSFHSSSYLPKLEANFMRDFTCCGLILPNLHDLLQHYEELHTQPSPNSSRNNAFNQYAHIGVAGAANSSALATGSANGQSSAARPAGSSFSMKGGSRNGGVHDSSLGLGAHTNMSDEMEAVADMEMDDAVGTMELDDSQKMHQTRQLFGQQQRPQLHMNTSGLTQGLRTSQPPTPAAASLGLQNNPTVSSVNTPTLTTHQQTPHSLQQQSSGMDLDEDIPGMPLGGGGAADMGDLMGGNGNNPNFCINDPGKHLFSPNGAFPQANKSIQAQLAQLGMSQTQLGDPEATKVLMARLQSMMMPEEHKPFKCPVIGCEKAYKNQNGLKYHKAHGHQTQQLHENGDGTFSIVNPETSAPYPGTLGMEKEKPFNCETCGKRYKNLNGLKYHKAHALPCNPDFKRQALAAGLTLPGIGEEQMIQ
ncbi:hypothetical protein S7711_04233 [Stachybotrys chartarum IBT 7711]|uniref:C2H2-type domain-containing protein n=1 Tax=Stachybotrys chartarum (strain CBS 109288 / IBT 7711) TaxID=1280523 RepID=A0A084AIL4_STACB|nr:hypothetical protein S7711_04233 [Stachybotrys chartarum IBT 7711]